MESTSLNAVHVKCELNEPAATVNGEKMKIFFACVTFRNEATFSQPIPIQHYAAVSNELKTRFFFVSVFSVDSLLFPS